MQRREQESEPYQVQAAVFKHRMEQKAIHQQPVRHFLSQRHLKSPTICPRAKYSSNKTSSFLHRDKCREWCPHVLGLWNCWHNSPSRRQGRGSNSLQPPQQRKQLTSIPSHRVFLSGQQRNIPVVQPGRCPHSSKPSPEQQLCVPSPQPMKPARNFPIHNFKCSLCSCGCRGSDRS